MRTPLFIALFFFAACSDRAEKPATDSAASAQKNSRPSFDGLTCYESVSPNANRMTPSFEYFAFSFWKGKIEGKGAGKSVGDPYWKAEVHGIRIGDSLRLQISYRQEGRSDTTVHETWHIDDKEKRIYRHNAFMAMGQEFVEIKAPDIPDDMAELMR